MFRSYALILGLVLALVCTPVRSWGQTHALEGQVRDPRGAAIRDATVTLYTRDERVRIETTTDSEGVFRFTRLSPGEYLVHAVAPGFAPAEARAVRVGTNGEATLDVGLELAGLREHVVVTAAGTAQNTDEVSKAVTVVDARQIEDRDEYLVTEALRTVPGLRVQQLGGPGSFVSIKTRGLRNEDTAVLFDGFRFRDAASLQADATGFLEDLVVTNADRIEVLRGSSSSLYGTNAIGGIINVVTDPGGGRTRGGLLVEGGTLDLVRAQANLSGGLFDDRFAYSLGASHLNVASGVDGDDASRITSGHGRALVRLSPNATLSGRIYTSNSFLQLNDDPIVIGQVPASGIVDAEPLDEDELARFEGGAAVSSLATGPATFIPSANDPDSHRDAWFFAGALTLSHRPNETFGYTVGYQGLLTNRSLYDGPAGTSFEPFLNTRSDFEGEIHTLNFKSNLLIGGHNLVTAGYEFENERFTNRSFPGIPSDNSTVEVTQRSHALFVQDQVRVLDERLQISAAFRAQFFTLDTPNFLPAASAPYAGLEFDAPPDAYTGDGSIAYNFRSSGTKLRAHVGNGYRAPSLYERFGTFFGSFGYSTFGDPRLRPDRSIAVDAGIDQSLFDNRARASATWFYTRLQEVISFDFSGAIDPITDPFGRFGGYLNTRGGLARGVELSFDVAPTPRSQVFASYTFTNADQREPIIDDIIQSFGVADHQVSLVVSHRFTSGFELSFDFVASSDYLAPVFDPNTFTSRVYRFDGLKKADLVGGYRWELTDTTSLRFFGKIENLLDREYFEGGFRTPGLSGTGGLQLNF